MGSYQAQVKNPVNFVLLVGSHNYSWRWRDVLSQDQIGRRWVKKSNVEDRLELQRDREGNFVCVGGDDPCNWEGAETLSVQLALGAGNGYVFG